MSVNILPEMLHDVSCELDIAREAQSVIGQTGQLNSYACWYSLTSMRKVC